MISLYIKFLFSNFLHPGNIKEKMDLKFRESRNVAYEALLARAYGNLQANFVLRNEHFNS